MSEKEEAEKKDVKILTTDDHKILLKHFDKDGNGVLDDNEINTIVGDSKNFEKVDPEVATVIKKFDVNQDGKLDESELNVLKKDIVLHESKLRYAGYSAAGARLFRYLAFTSDFGEALRPVLAARLVQASYGIAFSYCFVDIGWEAYKLKKRGYVTESGKPMSMNQLLVERTTFQAIASIAAPAIIIHTSVDYSKKLFIRAGRFVKWGPSVVGLAVIPLLPLYLDEIVEEGIEYFFHNYGPWSNAAHGDDKKHA